MDQLLRDGMPVDVSDGGGLTALHATMFNRTGVIKYLLHEGANVNRQHRYYKETPLHFAVRRNYTEAAGLLIENGADVNFKNNHNITPLELARKGSEVERLLLQLQ